GRPRSRLFPYTTLFRSAFDFQPPSWTGVAFQAVLLTAVCAGVRYAARRPGWRPSHVAALGTGVLAARGITGFFTEPLGDVSAARSEEHTSELQSRENLV